MACFVEEDWDELVRPSPEESIHQHNLRDCIKSPAGVPSVAGGRTARGEEHDSIATEVDVGLQIRHLRCRERLGRPGVDGDWLVGRKV